MKSGEVNRLISTIDTVPPLPVVVSSVLRVAESPNSNAADLAAVVSDDTALTARVLRVVNSPFYGFARKVTTVTESVVLLGFETIVNLVIGITVARTMDAGESHVLDRRRFWQHSLGTAAAARILSDLVDYPNPEETFIAGLMHDIGKLFFDEYLPDEYAAVVSRLRAGEGDELKVERDVLRTDHTLAGEMLLKKWHLPGLYQKAARYHHAPLRYERRLHTAAGRLVGAVYLADIFSKMHGDACDARAYLPAVDPHVWSLLGLEEEQGRRVFLLFEEEIQHAKEFLGVACSSDLGDIALVDKGEVMSVMIVCRRQPVVSTTRIILSSAGFDTFYGLLNKGNVEIPEGARPDIILLDQDDISSDFAGIVQLIAKIREKTGLKIIILRDGPVNVEEEKAYERQGVFMLEKPFRAADLIEKLRGILARPTPVAGSTNPG
ncbi:MAG: hypothetical protein DRP79_02080 [Planctomycetota bacterium]|nr:MAG: hypothetical protein DRP79_02080 [Planctomycetota bacterium]